MKVNFYATLREITGSKSVDFILEDEVSARQVLDAIINRFPAMEKELFRKDGRLYGHVHFFINGRDVQFLPDDLDTKIMPDDVITVFPAVGGG